MKSFRRYRKKKVAQFVSGFFAVALVLSACGYDGGTVKAKNGAVILDADEYRFSPSTVTTKPGVLRVTIRNRGALAHNLIILRGKKRYLVKRTPTFLTGSRTVTVNLRPGTYEFISNVGKDQELGLRGKILVRSSNGRSNF